MKCVLNTAWDQCLRPFLLAVTANTIQLLKLLIIRPVHLDRDREQDLEAAMQQVPDGRTNYEYHHHNNKNLDWAKIIVGFCLTAAVGLALIPFQIPSGQLPLSVIFYFFGLSVLLAFTCILVSKLIHFSYCPAGISITRIFHHFGLFFGVTSFFICVTIPFPLWFKCVAYSIYVAAFLLVVLCNKYNKTDIDPAVESSRGGTSTVDDQACTNSIV